VSGLPEGHPPVSRGFPACQGLVRFFALLRIKPHAPPLVRAPVNSFEFHSSFRAWTTRVSNPVCSPRFRASASRDVQVAAFAIGVPPGIYAFHRYSGNSATPSVRLARQYPAPFHGWAVGFDTGLNGPPTRPLRPVNPGNARTLRVTAAAGTELAGAISRVPSFPLRGFRPLFSGLHPEGLHPASGVAPSDLRPLRKIPNCCLP